MSFNFFLLPCKQGLTFAPYCCIKLQQRNSNSFKAARKKRCLKTYASQKVTKKCLSASAPKANLIKTVITLV